MALDFSTFIKEKTTILTETECDEAINDFCEQCGYKPEIENEEGELIPNPVSKEEFFNKRVEQHIIDVINARRYAKANEQIDYPKFRLS